MVSEEKDINRGKGKIWTEKEREGMRREEMEREGIRWKM